MADERLRLVAEVQDQFTGPLDKLNTALRRTASTGTQTGKDLAKDFEGFHGTLGKATSALQGMISPLQSLGVVGLGAGLGLGGIATALRSFSSGTQQLSILSKETGLAVNELRAFGTMGERFGVSADTMQGGVKRFGDEMYKLRHRYGEVYSELQAMNLGDMLEKMIASPNMSKALESAIEGIGQIQNPVVRRKVAEMLLGSDQFGAIAAELKDKYRKVLTEIIAAQGDLTKDTEKAAAEFEKNMSRMGNAAERLKLNTLGPLLKGLNTIVESGDRNGIRGNAEAMDADLAGRLASATKQRNDLSADPVKNAEQLKSLEKEIARLTDAIRRSKDPAGPSGVSAIPMSYSGGPLGGGGAKIYNASYGSGGFGGGATGGPALGGFGGPLPTLGGGYGGSLGGGSGGSRSGGSRGGGTSEAPVPTGPAPASSDAGNLTALIDREARRAGIDPRVMHGIRAGESGHRQNRNNPAAAYDHNPGTPGRPESSWGPFQLNRLRGLGQQFERETGLDVRDHRTIAAQARWVAEFIAKQTRRNPNYSPFPTWQGFHGRRESDPRWGDSGYVPTAPQQNAEGAGNVSLRTPSAPADENGNFPNGAPRALKPQSMADDPRVSGQVVGRGGPGGARMGDAMMRRLYGDQAPVARGPAKGSLDITLHGFPAGTKPRSSMDDLFKDVTVSKSRQMETTNI
ncbi:hypothetical protein [Methylobacterium sp. J-067]|uniref:hypothetical protein n=1 Tax=Methylobacterium sp. J-067 TaxID=2836648 RepID=UPI001FB99AAA|nr:hypothetical protein [Methylobacterium sp. J-067]MCJ2023383.1 hypothetical protein [Methylobacterium sp. J-067]